jgi:hypothetical protein
MSFRSLLRSILLISTLSSIPLVSDFNSITPMKAVGRIELIAESDPCDYTYDTVLINDIWWVIVYNCDGVIVDQYPLY